ncbi:hypothetical protein SDC9_173746 [bioreactor metagenome]|uniref:Uncharacterized protein n=1 Tax=bioreactor metagenome TaxID=1076179 RepID=A0A645GKD2_9ZZZZ
MPDILKKDKLTDKASYYTADGKPLLVNPGKTMINLVSDREPAVIEP